MKVTKTFSAIDLVNALIKAGELKPGQYGFKAAASLNKTLEVTEEVIYLEKKVDGRKKKSV